jgi:type IV pilus assembly protein PilE
MRKVRGFTLLELVITMVVALVLTTVAVSAYSKQARKSHRYDAVTAITNIMALQQRWRASHATFGSLSDVGTGLGTSTGGYYTLAMETPPSTGACTVGTKSNFNSYRITATATGSQASDTGCATLVLTNLCGVISKTSTGGDTCWPQ